MPTRPWAPAFTRCPPALAHTWPTLETVWEQIPTTTVTNEPTSLPGKSNKQEAKRKTAPINKGRSDVLVTLPRLPPRGLVHTSYGQTRVLLYVQPPQSSEFIATVT